MNETTPKPFKGGFSVSYNTLCSLNISPIFPSKMLWGLVFPVQLPGFRVPDVGYQPLAPPGEAPVWWDPSLLCWHSWRWDFLQDCIFASLTHLKLIPYFFIVMSSLSNFQVNFKGKWSICSCKFGLLMGRGEFRIFLHCHLGLCLLPNSLLFLILPVVEDVPRPVSVSKGRISASIYIQADCKPDLQAFVFNKCKYIQCCGTESVSLTGYQSQTIWRYPWAAVTKNEGSRWVYKLLSGRYQWAIVMQRVSANMASPGLHSLRTLLYQPWNLPLRLVLWHAAKIVPQNSAFPPRSQERFTVSPQMCV